MNTIKVFSTTDLTKCFQDIRKNTMDQTPTFSNILPNLSFSEMTSSPSTKTPPLSLPFSPQLGLHLQKTVLAVQRLRVEHSRVVEMSSKLVQERLDLEQHLEDMQATHQTKMEQMSSRWSSCQVLGQLSFRMLRY